MLDGLRGAGLRGVEWCEAPPATRAQLRLAHAESLLERVLDTPIHGSLQIDADTAMNEDSPEAAQRAAGGVCAAIDAVLHGDCTRAFCAVRPPGHHATADTAMGFCLFNSIAVGAAHAIARHGLQRVAIVDFDVHHGNGTQDIFEHDGRVLYLSTHQRNIYPGTGLPWERGVGNVLNVALPEGSGGDAFRAAYTHTLLPELDAFRPQLLLISAGFDAHRLDPLAGLNLDADDYAWVTRELVALAQRHARGRVVSALEGGYSLTALRDCSLAHVRALLD
ncbi:acetoin utilization deacetylase AcuC-like enzyme [Chiayiivirga flava]|uniref:Acetoin utilization deacetylase AcuC-like enzyme n=1 Tax=Chiayiivirga flava TaxID=659595 RepID=A0A7W8D7P9_9GAMM|nr:acetoin utilization deacetylase AcuC-like enzyme [Chiayiivirga flava]